MTAEPDARELVARLRDELATRTGGGKGRVPDCRRNSGSGVLGQSDRLGGCDHVPLCQGLNFRLSHRREVCVFRSDDPSRNVGMMGL